MTALQFSMIEPVGEHGAISHDEAPRGASPEPAGSAARVEEFMQLFTPNQRRVFLYILTLLPNVEQAEDVLQETNLILWREFHRFEPGTNFAAWACGVAYYQVLKYRKERVREITLLDEEMLGQVAEAQAELADVLEDRRAALLECLQKLPPADRALVTNRYGGNASGKELAETLRRPVNSIYQSLSRIRQVLWDCIDRTLRSGQTPGGKS